MSFTQKDYLGNEILLPNTILGYKQWYWKNSKLESAYSTIWGKESLTSVCSRYSGPEGSVSLHDSPDPGCTCGIYAHYLPLESYERSSNIFGVVEASGKILMGTKGFRAEKARVVALSGLGDCNHWFETKRKTRGIYPEDVVDFCNCIGVPYFPTVRQMVFEFPQVDLSSLGVPDLSSWKFSRDVAKDLYEQRFVEAMERLEKERAVEKELTRRFGIPPNSRMAETMRHLGGF